MGTTFQGRLNPVHTWIVQQLSRYGTVGALCAGTTVIVLLSVFACLVVMLVVWPERAFESPLYYVLSALVPLIVTAPVMLLFLSTVSALGTMSQEYHAMAEQHRLQSELDALTGVLNTRGLLARHTRFEAGTTVVLADIDRFKAINDAHGHHGGDRVLISMATELVRLAGPAATVARTGGDEFILVIPAGAGVQVPPQVRVAAADTIRATASLGVYVCPSPATVAEALCEADDLMYRTKGRSGPHRLL